MRIPLVALSLCAIVGGCGVQPRSAPVPLQASELDPTPIRAWLDYPTTDGSLSFTLNRPAYVAIFEVMPGRGARLIYPALNDRRTLFDEGFSRVFTDPYPTARWYYASSYSRSAEPTYLYLVASARPLRTNHLVDSPGALYWAMGSHFASLNHSRTFDALESLVLDDRQGAEWTGDVLVLWPNAPESFYASRPQQRIVQCANGRVLVLPWDYPLSACPGPAAASPPAPIAQRPDSTAPADTTTRTPRAGPPERSTPRLTTAADEPSAIAAAPEVLRAGGGGREITEVHVAPVEPEPVVRRGRWRAENEEPEWGGSRLERRERADAGSSGGARDMPHTSEPVSAPMAAPTQDPPATREAREPRERRTPQGEEKTPH
ncbi:MAG: hypothetical protein NVS1B4_21350 [Gemmatimonadaceae bacterium]